MEAEHDDEACWGGFDFIRLAALLFSQNYREIQEQWNRSCWRLTRWEPSLDVPERALSYQTLPRSDLFLFIRRKTRLGARSPNIYTDISSHEWTDQRLTRYLGSSSRCRTMQFCRVLSPSSIVSCYYAFLLEPGCTCMTRSSSISAGCPSLLAVSAASRTPRLSSTELSSSIPAIVTLSKLLPLSRLHSHAPWTTSWRPSFPTHTFPRNVATSTPAHMMGMMETNAHTIPFLGSW